MTTRIALLLLALVLAACEPMGPIPGRALSGEPSEPPSNWDYLKDVEVLQLETKGPYSINIWGVGIGENCYIASARGPTTNWAERIAEDAQVKLRVQGKLYSLKAVVVTSERELEAVTGAFKSKYKTDAEDDFPEAIVYRLEPR